MYCPNCGTRVSNEQKFCRTCGLGLQAVAQLLTQQLAENPSVLPAERPMSPVTSTDQSASLKWTYRFVFLGACVSVCGLMLIVVNRVLMIDRIIDLPAVFLLLIGAMIALYGVLMPKLHAPKLITQLPQLAELTAAETTSKLPLSSEAEPMASIIEHTTRQLEPVKARSGELS